MKIDFSKQASEVMFIDESRMAIDEADSWAKGWILSDVDLPVAKRRQHGSGNVRVSAGIVDQNIIKPFKIDEGVNLDSDNYGDFIK